MKKNLFLFCALLGFGAMASAENTIEVTLLEDQSQETTKATSVVLSNNDMFWSLFEAQDESLLLTVVVDNSACTPNGGTSEIGYANVGFGGNYTGTLKEGSTSTTVWLSAEGAGTVTATTTETYTFGVADIITLFSAEATQSWDLGATIWVDSENKSAWGGSYGSEPNVTTVDPYLDGSFELENLSSLQVQVNNSSVLVSVSYSYEQQDEEPGEVSANVAYSFDDDVWAGWQALADVADKNSYSITGEETLSTNGLIFYSGSDTKLSFQGNGASCLVGTEGDGETPILYTPAYRFQLGGAGQVGNNAKTLLGVPVEGACTIYVVAAAAGSSDERYLKAGYTNDTDLTTATLTALDPSAGYLTYNSSSDNNCLFSFEYGEEDATTVYLYSSKSGINIFYIYVSYDGTAPDFTATEESTNDTVLEGFLTVSVNSATVGDANQEVKVTVTEGDDDEITMSIDEIAISDYIKLSNVAITFTPDAITGEFTGADVNVNGTSIATATGSYEVENDDVTFTSSFTYTLIQEFEIEVSFTTVEPEPTWDLIVEAFDIECVADIQNADGTNNTLTVAIADIEGYEYVKLVAQTSTELVYSDWGALLLAADWNKQLGSNFTYGYTEGGKEVEEIIAVADILAAVADGTEEIYFVVWGNVVSAQVYVSGEADTESGTEEPGEETPELSTLYTFTGTVTIALADDPTSNNLAYGEVNQYNATSLVQLGNIDALGYGDFSGLTKDDIVTATVTIDFSACTATDYEGLILAFQGFTPSYGGWEGVSAAQAEAGTVELTLTTTIGVLMDANNIASIDDFGGLTLQLWNISTDNGLTSDYVGAVVTYTLTIEGVREGEDEGGSTAISNVNVEVTEVARYNLMGQKISGAEKGINIIVYSDGSAKKVLVK